jgi:hypothetical protein
MAEENFRTAYPEELETAERKLLACSPKWRRELAEVEPGERHQGVDRERLVGVGLSGGGIRSATFALGVFQGLARLKLLGKIDYLSTVSGGGYFGSFFGRLFTRDYVRGVEDVEEALALPGQGSAERGSPEEKTIKRSIFPWLRENGRYLSPNGAGDLLVGGAVAFRNWVAVQAVLVTLLLCAFLLAQLPRVWAEVALKSPGWWLNSFSPYFHWVLPFGLKLWGSPYVLVALVMFLVWAFPFGWAYWMVRAGDRRVLRVQIHPVVGLLLAGALAVATIAWAAGRQGAWSLRTWAALAAAAIIALGALLTLVFWGLGVASARKASAAEEARRRETEGDGEETDLGAAQRQSFLDNYARHWLSDQLKTALAATGAVLLFTLIDSLGQTVYTVLLDPASSLKAWGAGIFGALAAIAGAARKLTVLLGDKGGGKRPAGWSTALATVAAFGVMLFLLTAIDAGAHAVAWRFEPPVYAPAELGRPAREALTEATALRLVPAAAGGWLVRSACSPPLQCEGGEAGAPRPGVPGTSAARVPARVPGTSAAGVPGTPAFGPGSSAFGVPGTSAAGVPGTSAAGVPGTSAAAGVPGTSAAGVPGASAAAGVPGTSAADGRSPEPELAYRAKRHLKTLWLACLAVFVFSFLFGHSWPFLNRSSQLPLYSARLIRAYLGASNPWRHLGGGRGVTQVLPGDDMPVERYWSTRRSPAGGWSARGAPLHLINVTINETIDGKSQVEQKDRKGTGMAVGPGGISAGVRHHLVFDVDAPEGEQFDDVRVFPRQGYRMFRYAPDAATGKVRFAGDRLPLGQWLGISGAAFSTGLGSRTSLGLSLLTGFGNVRLGNWWNANVPPTEKLSWFSLVMRGLFPVQCYILDEFTARFPGTARRHWYLSDGGHFENMAGYELIRRRLPMIVILDAGGDPDYTFGGLSGLVRKARLDFGAEVEFLSYEELQTILDPAVKPYFGTLEMLRRGKWKRQRQPSLEDPKRKRDAPDPVDRARTSLAHASLARIYYDGKRDAPGSWLLYLKPTVRGDEPLDVLQYHGDHEAFPQESTADQFFDEAQWESYRRLGEHIANLVFQAPGEAVAGKWLPRTLTAPT